MRLQREERTGLRLSSIVFEEKGSKCFVISFILSKCWLAVSKRSLPVPVPYDPLSWQAMVSSI
jgi:hypothetical protein